MHFQAERKLCSGILFTSAAEEGKGKLPQGEQFVLTQKIKIRAEKRVGGRARHAKKSRESWHSCSLHALLDVTFTPRLDYLFIPISLFTASAPQSERSARDGRRNVSDNRSAAHFFCFRGGDSWLGVAKGARRSAFCVFARKESREHRREASDTKRRTLRKKNTFGCYQRLMWRMKEKKKAQEEGKFMEIFKVFPFLSGSAVAILSPGALGHSLSVAFDIGDFHFGLTLDCVRFRQPAGRIATGASGDSFGQQIEKSEKVTMSGIFLLSRLSHLFFPFPLHVDTNYPFRIFPESSSPPPSPARISNWMFNSEISRKQHCRGLSWEAGIMNHLQLSPQIKKSPQQPNDGGKKVNSDAKKNSNGLCNVLRNYNNFVFIHGAEILLLSRFLWSKHRQNLSWVWVSSHGEVRKRHFRQVLERGERKNAKQHI